MVLWRGRLRLSGCCAGMVRKTRAVGRNIVMTVRDVTGNRKCQVKLEEEMAVN